MKNKISTVLLSVILVFTLVLANFSVYATSNPGIGDTNGDKKIDLADVVYLAQYVAGWDVTLQSVTYADTTGDGKIDLVDVTYLAQYVAGWNVELGAAPSIISPTSPDFFNNSNDSNIWNYLPNEDEVNVLMWRKYSPSEQAVIDQYEQMTGVDIVTTFTTEAEYRTKLVSMVAYGNAPDVAILSVNQFPELVTKSMQPLKTAEFYLDSDCWNKTYMDAYKVNGRYYGVSIPSSLICDMYNYVTYYSPELLKSSGVTTMPYDLYKVGKWNWDTQAEIVHRVRSKGHMAYSMQSYDLFMCSAGADFTSYNGSQYTTLLGSVTTNDLLTNAWQQVVNYRIDGCLTDWDLETLNQNKVGLFSGAAYGLYKECDWFNSDFASKLEAVPMAGPKGQVAYTPVKPIYFGIPKKAKNSAGAAYFLRYFLDPDNYNSTSRFHNKQFEEVYKIITAPTAKRCVMYGSGVCDYIEAGSYSLICNRTVQCNTAADIANFLNQSFDRVELAVVRANKDLARI